MDPYEITVLVSFAMRIGAHLQREWRETTIEGFPPHLDRIYGDVALLTAELGVLIEVKRTREAIRTEERKELRDRLIDLLERDTTLQQASLRCHWLSFLGDEKHFQKRYFPEVAERQGREHLRTVFERIPKELNQFLDEFYSPEAPPQIGAQHEEFRAYLQAMSDLAGASDAETAAICLDLSEPVPRLQVVQGFGGLAAAVNRRLQRLEEGRWSPHKLERLEGRPPDTQR